MRRLCLLCLSLVWGLTTSQSAQAASYDCAKASTQVEHLICADEILSELDEEYSALYKAWYLDGKDRLSQRLWDIDRTWFEKKLTGRMLYEQLNVRSLKSLLSPRLESVPSKYLNEFYPSDKVRITRKSVEINHEGEYWKIVVTGRYSISVHNSIPGASYSSDFSLRLSCERNVA